MLSNILVPKGKFSETGGDRIGTLFLKAFLTTLYFIGMASYCYYSDKYVLFGLFVYSALFLIGTPLVIRYVHQVETLELYFFFNLCFIPFSTSFFSGGVLSPFFIWFLVVPLSAFFYLRKTTVNHWLVVSFLGVSLIFSLDFLGFISPNPFTDTETITIATTSALFAFTFIGLLVSSYVFQYQKRNKQFTATNKNLQKSNEDLENFAYVASHDLQTPLKSINSMVKMLRRHKKGDFEAMEEQTLNYIENSTAKLSKLIQEILQFSKAGMESGEPEVVNVQEVVEEIEDKILAKGTYQNFSIRTKNLDNIYINRNMILEVFSNLIDNALKYNNSKHKIIVIAQSQENDYHNFAFIDNGVGIAREYQGRIFGIFNRGENTSNIDEMQTGLGLAICKKLLLRNNGQIQLESALGMGSSFYIKLPVATPPRGKTKSEHKSQQPA